MRMENEIGLLMPGALTYHPEVYSIMMDNDGRFGTSVRAPYPGVKNTSAGRSFNPWKIV